MIVSRESLHGVIAKLLEPGNRGLDTETTGLTEDDSLFALIISDQDEDYYFNFNPYPDLDSNLILPRSSLESLELVFKNRDSLWFIHNAKFDLRMLAKENLQVAGKVHCTYAVERVIKNNYFGEAAYRLSGCAARRGLSKDTAVEEYVAKHKLFTVTHVPGKKKSIKLMHYERVPWQIMFPYGTNDGRLHRLIGEDQLKTLAEIDKNTNYPPLTPVVNNETRLTKTCFRMERTGIKLDKPFTATALEFELKEAARLQGEFARLTGHAFADSPKLFKNVFDAAGEKYPLTAKGNPSFAGDVLEEMDSPTASIINKIRYHDKRAGTYYSSFLHYADSSGIIHPDMRQAGTETGRFSYRDPNLQNVPKEDEEEDQILPFHVRECFVPRPGHWFYALDYKQMEYRMMLDLAGETKLIDAVMAGADVHDATAVLVGVSRKLAKTLNFAIIYGAGLEKLAGMLGVTVKEAKELRFDYFAALPKVYQFIKQVTRTGEARGFIFNWFGRRCHIAQSDWAYILPNHLIQGGCADVVKIVMNHVDGWGGMEDVKMILQVHDELLFEVPYGQESVVNGIAGMMENVYQSRNGMVLKTSVSRSSKRWGHRSMQEVYA